MFAADAELEAGLGRASAFGGDRDQLADALDVDADERVARIDPLLDIDGQELRRVVAADAERGLGQVVGAEREEIGERGDLRARIAARGSSIIVPTR